MLSREGLNPFENAVDITDPSHLSFDSENEISGEILNEACKIQASKDLPRERLPFDIQEDLKSLLEKEQHKFKEAAAKGSVSTLWQQLQHYRKIKIAEETESINKDLNFKLKHIQEQARKTEAIYREAYEEARQSMIRANFDAGRQFVFGATEKVHEAAVVQGVSDERVVDLRSGMCKKILLRDPAGELQSVYVVAAQEIDQQQIITADDIGNHFEYVMVDNSTSKTTSPKSAPQ